MEPRPGVDEVGRLMIHVVTWMHGDLHIRRHVVVVAIVRLSERSFCARTWLEHHFYIVIAARGTGMRPLEVSLLRPEGFLGLKLHHLHL